MVVMLATFHLMGTCFKNTRPFTLTLMLIVYVDVRVSSDAQSYR